MTQPLDKTKTVFERLNLCSVKIEGPASSSNDAQKKKLLFWLKDTISRLSEPFCRGRQSLHGPRFLKTLSDLTAELADMAGFVDHYGTSVGTDRDETLKRIIDSSQLVRVFVASVVSYAHPVITTTVNPSDRSAMHASSLDNRVLIERVQRFHDTYIQLSQWICRQATLHGDSVDSTPQPVSKDIDTQAHLLFEDFKVCALSVFEFLKSSGLVMSIDSPLSSQSTKEHGFRCESVSSAPCTTPSPAIESHSSNDFSSESSEDILTAEDHMLLTKLWSHLDTLYGTKWSSASAPPKPHFPVESSSDNALCLDDSSSWSARRRGFYETPEVSEYLHCLTEGTQPDAIDYNHTSAKRYPRSRSAVLDRARNLAFGRLSALNRRSGPAEAGDFLQTALETCSTPGSADSLLQQSPKSHSPSSGSKWDTSSDPANPLSDRQMQENIAAAAMQLQALELGSDQFDVVFAPTLPDGTGPDLSRAVPADESSMFQANAENSASSDHEEELSDRLTDDMPPKPLFRYRNRIRKRNRPLTDYIFRFGLSSLDDKICGQSSESTLEYFQSHWSKQEQEDNDSMSRSKTMSYVQQYMQQAPSGDLIKSSTCVEHTCTVRATDATEVSQSLDPDMHLSELASTDELTNEHSSVCPEHPVSHVPLSDEPANWEVRPAQLRERNSAGPAIISKLPPTTEPSFVPPKCESVLELVTSDHLLLFSEPQSTQEASVLAGGVDALTVYLTHLENVSAPSLFVKTFLTTYRTFLSSESLLDRLITRYNFFRGHSSGAPDCNSQTSLDVCNKTLSGIIFLIPYLKSDFSRCLRLLVAFQKTLSDSDSEKLGKAIAEGTKQHLSHRFRDMVNLQQSAPFVGSLELSDKAQVNRLSYPSESQSFASALDDVRTEPVQPAVKKLSMSVLSKPSPPHLLAVNRGGRNSTESPNRPQLGSHRMSEPVISNQESNLLSFTARELAEQLTYLEARKYDKIQFTELIDIKSLERGEAPGVSACAMHFSKVSNWVTFQMIKVNANEREKVAWRFLKVMTRLKKLQNYSGFLAMLCSFLLIPDTLFSPKILTKLDQLKGYMQPPTFIRYREELNSAVPPFIPYLGLMMQNLILLAQGNPLFLHTVPDQLAGRHQEGHGPVVNFWRCYKHFMIIHPFCKQCDSIGVTSRYSFKPNNRVLQFINDFQDSLPESDLRELVNQLRHEQL